MGVDPAAGTTRGAVAVRPARKAPLGWLLWLALALLALLLAGIALFLLNANDKGDDPGLDVTDDPSAQSSGTTGSGSGSGGGNTDPGADTDPSAAGAHFIEAERIALS